MLAKAERQKSMNQQAPSAPRPTAPQAKPDQKLAQNPGHNPADKPADKPAEKPSEESKLASSFLAAPLNLAPEAALIKASAPRNSRSDEQKAMDKVVADYHKVWVTTGKLTAWPALVSAKAVATYIVEPADVAKIRQYINRATALHNVRARYGTPVTVTPPMAKQYGMPDNFVGREVISFAVMDKRTRELDEDAKRKAVEKAKATREAKRTTK